MASLLLVWWGQLFKVSSFSRSIIDDLDSVFVYEVLKKSTSIITIINFYKSRFK